MSGIHIDGAGQMTVYRSIYRGTVVTIPSDSSGGTTKYRVTKANPVNLKVEEEKTGKRWEIVRRGVRYSEDQTFEEAPKKPAPRVFLGSTVRFTTEARRFPGDYVVIKKLADDRAQFAKLNGGVDEIVTGSLYSVEAV